MDATRSEIDTFKVMSNADFVDWSKASLSKAHEPHVILEADTSDDERSSRDSRRSRESDRERVLPKREDDELSHKSASSRSSRSSRRSVEEAADVPLPASRAESSSPSPPAIPLVGIVQSTTPIVEPPAAPSPPDQPLKRTLPIPKKYTAAEENEDYEVRQEKEALLQDILTYERPPHNMKLTRQWNVDQHTLDELQFEYDRIQSELNANQMVEMAKSGIKFGVGGIEMFLKQSGFNAVDGWYKNSCNDMNKYNRPLIKLYKRYWRKTSMSPLMELAFLMFGGLAWTVFENKILRGAAGFGGGGSSTPSVSAPPPPVMRPTEYEPPRASSAPTPGGMRPPSLGTAMRGPRWTAATEATATPAPTPTPVPAAPTPIPSPAPAPAPPAQTDPALLSALSSISQQNALMMQALQAMQSNSNSTQRQTSRASSRASSPRSNRSRSSLSSHGTSKQLRFPMKRTPKSRPGTARGRKDAQTVMAL